MKRNGWRVSAYPFDWIFSDPAMVMDCMATGFVKFLDRSCYVELSGDRCGHSAYHDRLFNHHDPLGNAAHYRYYVRGVKRFRKLLGRRDHVLFTMMMVNKTDVTAADLHEIRLFNIRLSGYTSNYTLLVIFHLPNKPVRDHVFIYEDNIHFLELHTGSASNGVEFESAADNLYLDEVMGSSYTFDLRDRWRGLRGLRGLRGYISRVCDIGLLCFGGGRRGARIHV
jgi:hypothetical protein